MQDISLKYGKSIEQFCIDYLIASSYTRVTNCQKWSDFYGLNQLVFWCSIVSLNLSKEYFKKGDIQYINLTPDKELSILIYWTPSSYVIIYRSHTLLKMVCFGPPYIRPALTSGGLIKRFFKQILELFFEHSWNNWYHCIICTWKAY